MKTIIFDTNFLLIPGTYKVDIFAEAERLVPDGTFAIIDKTIDELEHIIHTQKGKNKSASVLALTLIKTKGLKKIVTNSVKSVDEFIVEFCDRNCLVATQDLELRKKLINKGIAVLVLRNKNHLVLIEC